METTEIGSFGPHSIYPYVRVWYGYDIIEWEDNSYRESVEEEVKYYSAELENVNAELELCKKQAKLYKRHVKLRKMKLKCNLEYHKTLLECGLDYDLPEVGFVDYISDELYEIEKELSKIEVELQGRYQIRLPDM